MQNSHFIYNKLHLSAFVIFLLAVAIFYSGFDFISNFSSGIAAGATGGGIHKMMPGDHHEQFYRYSLFSTNILRGNWPYYTGYQFASCNFTEGLIFFPFTVIAGCLALIFGNIVAYNLMVILSFISVGLAGYAMVKKFTKSPIAGMVAGTFLATVPFRTSFLYGQMVFGVDIVLFPLFIYFVECAKESNRSIHFFIVGLVAFLITTANFQLCYWFAIIFFPYFIYVTLSYISANKPLCLGKFKSTIWVIPGLTGAAVYLIYIYTLMKGSALGGGQNFDETLFYTPDFKQLFSKYSGNEKNVYLGFSAVFVFAWIFARALFGFGFAGIKREFYMPLFFLIFCIGMFFTFGPKIDSILNISIYRWLFEHVPGFSGTRTPGRIMGINIVAFSIILGFFVANFNMVIAKIINKKYVTILSMLLMGVIVLDFKVINPIINTFDENNKSYLSISGTSSKVLPIPFQLISADYRNSTFLTYALKYNIRILSGHSSIYPSKMDEIARKLFSINDGNFTKNQWEWLKSNNYGYLVAHDTEWLPNVSKTALASLYISPYLEFLSSDNGVHLFRIISSEVTDVVNKGIDFKKWASKIISLQSANTSLDPIIFASGWYSREVYPNQKPFRWMQGTESIIAIPINKNQYTINFEYNSPYSEKLIVNVHGAHHVLVDKNIGNGWSKITLKLSDPQQSVVFIQLNASQLFKAPPDIREFGVQVSDISIQDD
jgi:hypothetical protein